ncbi:uncharacterized protein PFLUO_LOCUS1175 [Penicillium psychrofluorescens]|uniref:uncharacterized protein n=1 Tax=Penicillium psychrofluorescens TaxID=3158075 RepID=UPI003CCDA81F
MSFGFGVGDFLAILALANDLRGRFAQAPQEYKAITEEVESLIFALHRIDGLDEKEFGDQEKEGVNKVIQGCDNVLQELDSKLSRLHIVANDSTSDWKGRVRQSWERIRWDQAEINNFRSRIVSNISLLNLIIGNTSQQGIQTLNQRQEDQERDNILSWLSPVSPSVRQSEIFNSHQKGTGTWLPKTVEFQRWIGSQDPILFCPGIPGSGKTVLSSIVIDHLEHTFPNQNEVGIAYLYCDYRQQHSLFELYSALLRQIVQRKRSIPESVKSFHQDFSAKGTRPSKDEVLSQFRSVLASCARSFVVIDALDECPISDGNISVREPFLRELVRLQNEVGFNLLVTSRPDQEIASHFEGATSLEIQASSEDIQYYVDVRLNDLPSFVRKREKLKQSIKESITESAKDIEGNEKGIRKMLEQFRTGSQSNAYYHAYGETMSRIERQGANASDLAKKTIGWIINAKRNLTVAELEHALAVECRTLEFDETNITDIEQLTSYCCGLVLVDEQTTQVKLVHYTTQKYFESTWTTWFPEIHELISDSCLTYVSYDVFEEDRFEVKEEFEKIQSEYPFYNYSSLHWGHHYREWPGNRSLLMNFLQSKAKLLGYDRCGFDPQLGTPRPETTDIKAEHIVAFFNLTNPMQELLEANPDNLDIQNSRKQSPLSLAAYHGHEMMTKLLLDRGANIDIQDTEGEGPLHMAAKQGHATIVKLLLDKGADIEIGNPETRTPLFAASQEGRDIVVTLLLDRGANVNAKTTYGRTALHEAAMAGKETTARLLLSRGADIESKNEKGEMPIHDASLIGNATVVQLFLNKGVSPNATTTNGDTPLHMVTRYLLYSWINKSAKSAHDEVVEVLLNNVANIEAKNNDGDTPLHRTAGKDYQTPTRTLLDHGANVEARNNGKMTPLHLAVQAESEAIVKMLLDQGSSVDPMNYRRQTPLHIAAIVGNEAIATILLDKDAKFDVGDRSGYTPLLWAAHSGHEFMVRLLLEKGANPNPPSFGPQQLPSTAAEGGHDAVLKTSIAQESNPDQFNVSHRSALHLASAGGHTSIARLLLSAGAKPDTLDRYGRSPLVNAVCGGHSDMVQLLLSLPDVEKDRTDVWGLTPALEAQKRELHEIYSLLCGNGKGM